MKITMRTVRKMIVGKNGGVARYPTLRIQIRKG